VRSEIGRREIEMHSRRAFDSQSPPHLVARMLVFVIVCGGFVLGGIVLVGAQYHGDPDHIVYPGLVGSRSRDRALGNKPAGDSADDSDTPVNWYRLTSPASELGPRCCCSKFKLIWMTSSVETTFVRRRTGKANVAPIVVVWCNKYGFAEVSKTLARYRSEKNFVWTVKIIM